MVIGMPDPPGLEEIDRDSGFPGSRRIISGLPVTPFQVPKRRLSDEDGLLLKRPSGT
jgi:hypothetical protein